MILFIIGITVIVLFVLWFFINKQKDFEFAQKPAPVQKPNQGTKQVKINQGTKQGIKINQDKKVNQNIKQDKKGIKINQDKKDKATKINQGRENVSTINIPTYDHLKKALAAYTKYNKSGKVNPSSSYTDLVQAGYLQFQNGKWVINPNGGNLPGQYITQQDSSKIKLPLPKNSNVFHNNSYGQQGYRIPDKNVQHESGYIVTDPGNLLGLQGRDCKGDCSMLDSKDAKNVKKIVDKVTQNGGSPIGYMSLTIEPTREDVKGLIKGKDYTSNYMQGWDEYGPKLTQNYINLMKKRIDLYAQAGFKAMEFDNIDIIDDKNVSSKIGISSEKWKGFVKDLVTYANSKGIGVVQKNTPNNWGKDMNNLFVGAIIETNPKNTRKKDKGYDWNQVQNILEQGNPVFLNNTKGNCDSVLKKVREWTGGTGNDHLIMGCKNK